jgi:hypothetical protein
MDRNNFVIIKNNFDLMGIAYKYLLGNLVHEKTTIVPISFMLKKKKRPVRRK